MPAAIPIKGSSLKALFENLIFLSTVSSLFIAQLLKAVIFLLSGRRKKKLEFIEVIVWRTGGMPSSHSAVVTSLAASIAFAEGLSSNLFIIAFWFALVVVRDAMGVRRSAGLLAKALNNLGKQAAEKVDIDFRTVKEIQGHTPLEVIVGGLLGIFIAAAFAFL
ncbi:MAG: divergent PAP2 family protein [Treponema sp.]|jgi:acid phosphatase family membrane protein YuiD|nr:divergent PAP2 family protein [Treponema sp.]